MRPLLDLLAQDRFQRRAVSTALKGAAALLVLLNLPVFFHAGRVVFDLPVNGILGGVLFEVCFVLAVYVAAHTLLIRAHDIFRMPPGEYPALRIAPLLLRALAEAYAGYVSLVAVGAAIFVWFTNLSLEKVLTPAMRALFPNVRSDPSFMGGIEFMLIGVLVSIAILFVTYVVADAIGVLVARFVPVRQPESMRPADERFRSRFGA